MQFDPKILIAAVFLLFVIWPLFLWISIRIITTAILFTKLKMGYQCKRKPQEKSET